MAYEFIADSCENCGEPLVANENTETVEAQDTKTYGYCTTCFVFSEMTEV